jgi:hypothetical protein
MHEKGSKIRRGIPPHCIVLGSNLRILTRAVVVAF